MPDPNTINIDLYAGNTEDCPFSADLFGADGLTRGELAEGDVVYCVLSEQKKNEPFARLLKIASDDETDDGSVVVVLDRGSAAEETPAAGYVRFAQGDTAAIVETWDDAVINKRLVCELFYLDSAESDPLDAKKLLARGFVTLHRSASLT